LQPELADAVRNTVAMQNGEAPRRTLENGERNLDPNRSDGPPPPKRVARAMISSPPNGSGTIPVTLGGRLPGISALSSRREFGLRALKR
jgi:hypothetical protein